MRIAFYTDTYLPNKDGVVVSLINFREELENRGHEVFVFASGTRKAKKENKDKHVEIHTGTTFTPYPDYKIALFPFLSERTVRKWNADVIHSHGMATMGLAADRAAHDLSLPYVATLHTLVPRATHYVSNNNTFKSMAEKMTWEYLKVYYNRADVATAPSKAIKQLMVEHGIRHTHVIPNGVDLEKFLPEGDGEKIRKRHRLEKNKVVMHIGRLALEKNLEVLISAAKKMLKKEPGIKFLIVGKGPAEKHYKQLVKKHDLANKFIFTGFVPDDEVNDYYAAADITVVPSTFETQGLVTLEAMACGKPVAGADCLATKEIIKNGKNGYLFEPGNAVDCAEKVLETLRKKEQLAKNTLATAKGYSIPKCTGKLLKLYRETIKKK